MKSGEVRRGVAGSWHDVRGLCRSSAAQLIWPVPSKAASGSTATKRPFSSVVTATTTASAPFSDWLSHTKATCAPAFRVRIIKYITTLIWKATSMREFYEEKKKQLWENLSK